MRRSVTVLSCFLLSVATLAACDGVTDVDPAPDLVAVVAGSGFSCALATDGTVYCWGANTKGQMGRNTISEMEGVGAVAGGLSFDAIAAGEQNVCGLSGGRAYCWGDGALLDRQTPAPAPVAVEPDDLSFVSVTVGGLHACGLTAVGAAWCWGQNTLLGGGQLGDGTITPSARAVAVVGGLAFDQVDAGFVHTCGRAGAGVWCWGSNYQSALGLADVPATAEPASVTLDAAATSIAAGAAVSCAGSTGEPRCWGFNNVGQLGRGAPGAADPVPAAVSGAGSLTGVLAAPANRLYTHICGLSDAGRPICWGSNEAGQLGRATDETCTASDIPCGPTPGAAETELSFGALAVSGTHTCGIAGGTAYCWGANGRGQLGAPGAGSTTPVPVEIEPDG